MIGSRFLKQIIPSSYKLTIIRNSGQYQRPSITNSFNYDNLRDIVINLARKQNVTNNDFKNLRTNLLLNKNKNISEINVDYLIVSMFNASEDLNFVENYIAYLKNENLKVNFSTLGRLMRLYYTKYLAENLTPDQEKKIQNICEEISKKHNDFDAVTCENLIFGLICTNEWKKSLELFDTIKLSAKPSNNVYSAIISKAFKNATDHELGWKLLLEMVREYKKQPNCEIFISLFKWIQDQDDSNKQINNMNKFLDFIGDYDIIISKLVVHELRKTLECMNWKNNETNINYYGKCGNCNSFLEKIFITSSDFKRMRSEFLDRVLIRKDVFVKSNPKELDKFLNFIDKNAPYHCVIDGLNVAYSIDGRQSPDAVCSVIKYFKELNMNTLLIGRKHMNKWPKESLNYIKKNSLIFFTDDLSQDDPFLLYAALKSGPATHIFSRDLMRSHLYLLGDDLRNIFKRWLQEHLYSLITIKRNGKLIIKEPNKYNINAHKVGENWHIPYRDVYQTNPKDSYNVPENWICITATSYKKED